MFAVQLTKNIYLYELIGTFTNLAYDATNGRFSVLDADTQKVLETQDNESDLTFEQFKEVAKETYLHIINSIKSGEQCAIS